VAAAPAADQNRCSQRHQEPPSRFRCYTQNSQGVWRTVKVNVVGSGGTAWHCQQDGCGAHDAGLPREAATVITYSTAADRQWDATYELGMRDEDSDRASNSLPLAAASATSGFKVRQFRLDLLLCCFSSSRPSWSPLGRTPLIALFRCAKPALQVRALVQRSSRLTVKTGKRHGRHVIKDAFRLPGLPFTP
jgi:hypothetical protein